MNGYNWAHKEQRPDHCIDAAGYPVEGSDRVFARSRSVDGSYVSESLRNQKNQGLVAQLRQTISDFRARSQKLCRMSYGAISPPLVR